MQLILQGKRRGEQHKQTHKIQKHSTNDPASKRQLLWHAHTNKHLSIYVCLVCEKKGTQKCIRIQWIPSVMFFILRHAPLKTWDWIRKAKPPASHISVSEAWNVSICTCRPRSFQILAPVLLFPKASESDRRTGGYRLVLVIAQRVRVINNKGGKGEGHSNITLGPGTE